MQPVFYFFCGRFCLHFVQLDANRTNVFMQSYKIELAFYFFLTNAAFCGIIQSQNKQRFRSRLSGIYFYRKSRTNVLINIRKRGNQWKKQEMII